MKLSELIERARELYPDIDPDVRVAGSRGFLQVVEVLPRSVYYDEGFFGTPHIKGEFIVIETGTEL